MFCWSQLLCSVKKLKQEVLLDQCCLHLAEISLFLWENDLKRVQFGVFIVFQEDSHEESSLCFLEWQISKTESYCSKLSQNGQHLKAIWDQWALQSIPYLIVLLATL